MDDFNVDEKGNLELPKDCDVLEGRSYIWNNMNKKAFAKKKVTRKVMVNGVVEEIDESEKFSVDLWGDNKERPGTEVLENYYDKINSDKDKNRCHGSREIAYSLKYM